ncbi:hypothetical protein NMT80_26080, partial [Escherichia coli]|nr:hypothetical protein [Escherichia coli]
MTQRFRSIGIAFALACAFCSAQAAPCDAPAPLNDGWQIEAEPAAAVFDARKLCAVLHKVVGADI